jgi:hypothetical protein
VADRPHGPVLRPARDRALRCYIGEAKMRGGDTILLVIALAIFAIAGIVVNQRRRLAMMSRVMASATTPASRPRRLDAPSPIGGSMLNKELAKKIRDGETVNNGVYDFYDVGPSETNDVFELERAGMIELACLYHPVSAAWRISDRGSRWLKGERWTRDITEIVADIHAIWQEMKQKDVRRTRSFNSGLSGEAYELNARMFALETELEAAKLDLRRRSNR